MRYGFGCAILVLLLPIIGCKTRGPASGLKDLVVTAPDGSRRVYFLDGDLIKTGLCAKDAKTLPNQMTVEELRKICSEQLTAGVTAAVFRENILNLFKQTYRTESLSSNEVLTLNRLIAEIQDNSINTTDQADESKAAADDIASIWPQFMPFAAGVSPMPFPEDLDRTPIQSTIASEVKVSLTSNGTEYEVNNLQFADAVNLFGLVANKADNSGSCPGVMDVLSVTRMDGDTPVPVFGGAVVGGSRFLLNMPASKVSSVRFVIYYDEMSTDFTEGMECTVGLTASLIEPLQTGYKVRIPDPVKMDERDLKMAAMMAKPEVRAWHFLWHGIRNSWPSLSEDERNDIRTRLGKDWDAEAGGTGNADEKGEEFLHMHHAMLGALRSHLGDQMYEAWLEPPKPDDAKYPVPQAQDPTLKKYFDARYKTLMTWHKRAIDEKWVKTQSLSEYGLWLEANLHNNMHMTWAHPTQWYTSYEPSMEEIMSQPNKYPAFNHPSNNSLAGTYTSHVNPNFYRLHGYVDARIQTWLKAHDFDKIAEICPAYDSKCYQWKRTWDGGIPAAITDVASHQHSIDPAKIAELKDSTFREVARASQMIPGTAPTGQTLQGLRLKK